MTLEQLPGDADAIAVLAETLRASATRFAATGATTRSLGPGACWDGGAGRLFGERVAALAPVLDAAASRYAACAAALRTLAPVLADSQRTIAAATDAHAAATQRYAALENRIWALLCAGRTELDAEVIVLRQSQVGALEAQTQALAAHRRAMADFEAADAACAATIREACDDAIADSAAYRGVLSLSEGGWTQELLAVPGMILPPLGAVLGVLQAGADATLEAQWGEGGWGTAAASAALAGAGSYGKVLKSGAVAGARWVTTAKGERVVEVTERLTRSQRIDAGLKAQRDAWVNKALRGDARYAPVMAVGDEATPMVLGRRAPSASVPFRERLRALPATARERSAATARARYEATPVGQWRLASGNGREAAAMYAAGVTLEEGAGRLAPADQVVRDEKEEGSTGSPR